MLYSQRKEFIYDPQLNTVGDTVVALKVFDEYCRRYSPRPTPRFFEVDRSVGNLDELWHMPKTPRTQFKRTLDLQAINQFQKPDWKLTKMGIAYQRRDLFWLSNLELQRQDYFPLRGDIVYWVGYRYIIVSVNVPPEAYWGQTGVWTGITVDCVVPPDGDAIPAFPEGALAPAEISTSVTAG